MGWMVKHARFEALVGAHFAQVGVVEQAVLVEFVFHVGQRELRAPHRHLEFRKHPGQRANVVFVSVSENDAADTLAILNEIGDVGNNDVDAKEFSLGKHEARVDDENVVAPAHGHAIHAELAQATEGDYLQFSAWH